MKKLKVDYAREAAIQQEEGLFEGGESLKVPAPLRKWKAVIFSIGRRVPYRGAVRVARRRCVVLCRVWLAHGDGGMQLPCTCKPAKGARRDAASRRPSSSGRGARCDPLTPCLDSRGGGSRPIADAERGTPMGAPMGAPMGRKGCVRGAKAVWGPSFGLSRGTRRSPWSFGGAAAATVAAAEAAEAAEAATVAGAKARGSNDMTESGLRRDSSVRPGLSSSSSMMRVAARSVKPSCGLVCTKWPAHSARRDVGMWRGACRVPM